MSDDFQQNDDGYPVTLPSGATFKVLTPSEVEYVEQRVERYMSTYKWDNVSDIQDVDRIVTMELLCYRWAVFLAQEVDYRGDDIDDRELRKNLKEYTGEIRLTKKSVGMDKNTREKESGAGSLPDYIEKLRQRARAFGISRNKMMDKGLLLSQQVIALVTLWNNSDEQERIEFQATAEDVCKWLRDVYVPEFQAVDEEFRRTQQTLWIEEM